MCRIDINVTHRISALILLQNPVKAISQKNSASSSVTASASLSLSLSLSRLELSAQAIIAASDTVATGAVSRATVMYARNARARPPLSPRPSVGRPVCQRDTIFSIRHARFSRQDRWMEG